jgi:hypothetical protein
MGFIDVDTHVLECEDTWDCMDPADRQYRPVPVEVPAGTAGNRFAKQMYLIGDTLVRRFPTDGRAAGFGAEYSGELSHLWDPSLRLKKMDALGIDVQIVISTNFIGAQLEDPVAEASVTVCPGCWYVRPGTSIARFRSLNSARPTARSGSC